ncbi:MAG: hypothetical protein ACFB4I_14545 [Cyanophyceae cyanobacterium]
MLKTLQLTTLSLFLGSALFLGACESPDTTAPAPEEPTEEGVEAPPEAPEEPAGE